MNKYIEFFNELLRMSPCIYFIISIILGLILQNSNLLFFAIGLFINEKLNTILKTFFFSFKSLRHITSRPIGAIQCSCLYNAKATIPSTYMGMPSGHCQAGGFVLGFWWNHIKSSNDNIILQNGKLWAVLLFLCLIVSRLENNILSADMNGCHTILQTFVGSIVGLFLGYLWNILMLKLKL